MQLFPFYLHALRIARENLRNISVCKDDSGCYNEDMNRENDFYAAKFNSIQALRGIAALFVVLEHIRFLNCGAFGVDIFFCISGFMILFSTQKSTDHFLSKRLIRIVPFYWLMTLVTYALLLLAPGLFAQTKADPVLLVKSLFFIPFNIGGGLFQPLLRIGWTINCEIFFYILFYISFKISHKYRGLICSGLLMLTVLLAALFPSVSPFLSFYGDPVMLEFILGMMAQHICHRLYTLHMSGKLPRLLLPFSFITATLCFTGLLVTRQYADAIGFRRPILWGLPALVILLCFFLIGLHRNMPGALTRLGDISFSLYLIHYYPVTFLDRKVFDFSAASPRAFFGVAVCFAVSTVLALFGYEIIEKRFSGWLRRKLLKPHR